MTHQKQIRYSNLPAQSTILSLILSLGLPLLLPTQAVFAKKKVEAEPAAPVYAKDEPGCREAVAKAATLFAANKNTEAVELLRPWSSKCMQNAQLHLLLSTILLRLGKTHEEAESEAKIACQITPNSTAAHMQHALTLMAMEKTSQAKDEFERITEIDPTSYDAWSTLSDLYGRLNQMDKAKACGEKAGILDPQTRRAKFRTLHSLHTTGKADALKNEVGRLLSSDIDPPEYFDQLATEALSVGAYSEAVQAANKALDKYPKSTSALKAKALGLLFSNSLDEARSTVDSMLSVSPEDIDVLAIKAMILSEQGNSDESELCLKKLVERSDKRPLFFLAKGKLASQRNETEEAIKNFEQALAGDQSLLVVHSCLADAFIKAGRFEDALSEAKECQRVPGLKALGVDYEAKAKEGMNQK
ncbi:MAG: hypothetical protein C0469_05470 [Cyanobacteria bacterium DS2.3.42]|nr:hypothetical protein [Cyanobacteria bacterium DS2.3.42]